MGNSAVQSARGPACGPARAEARRVCPPDVAPDSPHAPRGDVPRRDGLSGAAPGGDARPPRRVLVHHGVEWTVTECDGTHVPGSRGAQCLIFASPEAIRRVWDVPPDWHTLGDAELFALSWRR